MGASVRDWSDIDIDADTPCRCCGSRGRTTRAHLAGRRYDEKVGKGRWKVHPDDVIPLCGPVGDSRSCHEQFDRGQIDILGCLTVPEQVRVVEHLLGIEAARIRLAPLSYPSKVAA